MFNFVCQTTISKDKSEFHFLTAFVYFPSSLCLCFFAGGFSFLGIFAVDVTSDDQCCAHEAYGR